MRSYLFTNVTAAGKSYRDEDDGITDVMVFVQHVSLQTLESALRPAGFSWDEAYEVPGKDVQYYLAQHLYLEPEQEQVARRLAGNRDHASEEKVHR